MNRKPAIRRPFGAASLALLCLALGLPLLGVKCDGFEDTSTSIAPDTASVTGAMSAKAEATMLSEIDPAPSGTRTVRPQRSDAVLTNPGEGFASFHFGWWCNLPPITYSPADCAKRVRERWPKGYPNAGTAYFRWFWRDLEPTRGQIAFDVIDAAIQSANQLGMTLGFRVMTVDEGKPGLPSWLLEGERAVPGEWLKGGGGKTFWPDYGDESFQKEHARLIKAIAERYDGHPAVDHVDIGVVGCWGEWNTACISGVDNIIEVYRPSNREQRANIRAAYERLIDQYLATFTKTPLIMLSLDADEVDMLLHATSGGAGWRADCWGDWGLWGGSWSHQTKLYPQMLKAANKLDPTFADVWKRAPVHLEVCGTMERWQELGWTTSKPDGKATKSFEWALQQHASFINAKSKPVPASYGPAVDEFLNKLGYRLALEGLNHPTEAKPGDSIELKSVWTNRGVAPPYGARTLTYRLRGPSKTVTVPSVQDVRTWLPGPVEVRDSVDLPAELAPGTYELELAMLDRDGANPDTKALPPLALGIDGRRPDGWYAVSTLEVVK
jgi:hypothetical protein